MIPNLSRRYQLVGLTLFLGGVLSGTSLCWVWIAAKGLDSKILLENPKVQVTRVIYENNSIRAAHSRPQDQVIVFLDDAHYEVVYANGKKETRDRKSGDVIWHSRGEEAPTLTNTGPQYRTVVVNFR